MVRRYSPLFAVFVLSGLLTRAGMASAGDEREALAAAAEGDHEAAVAWTSPFGHAEAASSVDWRVRIDDRLAALADDRPAPEVPDPDAPDPDPARRALDHRVQAVVDQVAAGLGARVGVHVRDLDTGHVIAATNDARALNPASNQKLITAIAAVELLGADYRFETRVLRDGDALIVQGSGDPDLHVADLHQLASALDPADLDGVQRIVVDDSAFSSRQLGPGFRRDGVGESYMAPSGALALDYATVEVEVRPAYGDGARVSVSPPGAAIVVENHARTGVGELTITSRAGDDGQTIVRVDGAIPGGHAPVVIRRRVADPGLVAGAAFADVLADVTGALPLPVERGVASPEAHSVAVHRSGTLVEVLGSAMRWSNNFTAEQVLRTLAWRATGNPGSWADAVDVLDRFAIAISPDRAEDQAFVNGSGLARDGRLTPAFIVDALALVERPGSDAQALLASFAEAGGEGTLRYRVPSAGPRLLAKTGTYAGASSLSGVVFDEDGARTLGFSIVVNGGDLDDNRAGQNRIAWTLVHAFD